MRREEALEYHRSGRPGKIEVISTKPVSTQHDLSLAYTPGVAEPCREIAIDVEKVYEYTAKGNLVAVVSNGTAVLGLGNIGPEAGKPVMEGKGVLFKTFADIDVFDIELNVLDPSAVIEVVAALEPTFGGINLEDIKAPECFEIEEALKARMNIPVFHDDQHGTAIISGAALLNACELQGKEIADLKIVVSGAGAAAISCARFYVLLGATRENIFMCDSRGLVHSGRTDLNPYKEEFANGSEPATLGDVMVGADVFIGLSQAGVCSKEMVASMADRPIVFAMSNPDPEITWEDATSVREDLIMATGRSDYPNQVNNVLGFPFIFRGALDVRARAINDEMKLAAAHALAQLAREDVPDAVIRSYGDRPIMFGPDYIIPKPFDHRVLLWVAPAVARAAIETGVARKPITDWDAYADRLEARLGRRSGFMVPIINRAQSRRPLKRLVFPEGEELPILRAAQRLVEEGICQPVVLGFRDIIDQIALANHVNLDGIEIIDPITDHRTGGYARAFFQLRGRKGVNPAAALRMLRRSIYFGLMMVREGEADGLIAGVSKSYPDVIRPALQVVGRSPRYSRVAGVYIMMPAAGGTYFLADTTVNIDPTAEHLAEIAMMTAETARRFGVTPRVAMLSFSNFGDSHHEWAEKVRRATELVRAAEPGLVIDGEMHADAAVVPEILKEYSFSTLEGSPANVLVFPNIDAGNIAYKLLMRIGGCEAIGPILVGMNKPVHVLQRSSDVQDIFNVSALTVTELWDAEAQNVEADQLAAVTAD
ncbi:MAG TPA: NADP-dependent malic enzyme [Candidatus Kapabacteria bacterium]|jgi:malate dehydrogenase (oxaloacetate-decarboxylating)(NADP+)|nr:NADP-dependent malic enzyme [Candidatus Kapabacteria bacterium]